MYIIIIMFVNFKFSQVARSGRAEASRGTEKRVCAVFVNQWAASGEKQDEERYSQFGEPSGQGEKSCFKLLVAGLSKVYLPSRKFGKSNSLHVH